MALLTLVYLKVAKFIPALVPLEPPAGGRVRGVRQLVGESLGVTLVHTELDEQAEESSEAVLPPLAPDARLAPPVEHSAAEDRVEVAETAGSYELVHPTWGWGRVG